ncbi:MAG: FHA domain-containing protein [Candidatus Wallbacteria bacterium]|nr:FHA domain-containing protein [Candidatus Wallbacteria bacterium]
MSLFCPRCGSATGPRDRFCKGCGGNLQTLRQKMGSNTGAVTGSRVAPAARAPIPARPAVAAMVSAQAPAVAAPARQPTKPAAAPAPPKPAPRISIPDLAEPAPEDDDLFAGMKPRAATEAPAPAGRVPASAFQIPDAPEDTADEGPDLPPMRPAVPAPAPARPAQAAPARAAAPAPAAPAPATDTPGGGLNFFDLDNSLGGHSAEEVDFSSLSSPALAADEGASFYDLDALSSSGAPVPPAEGGEAVYDLDSFFSGSAVGLSGPSAAPAPAEAGAPAVPGPPPAKAAPKQELVDFSALSSSEPSAYDLDSLSLLGGSDPFASLLVPSQVGKGSDSAIGKQDVADMEKELARASTGTTSRRPPAGSPCIVVYQANKAVHYHSLGNDETFLGKDEEGENTFPGLDLSRYDPSGSISPLHASILCEGNKYFIQDIPQSTGTKVNGSLIPKNQKVPLKDGDALLLGNKVLLRFEVMK